jgi:hypothetical protein
MMGGLGCPMTPLDLPTEPGELARTGTQTIARR